MRYMTQEEMKTLDNLLTENGAIDDTLSCWIATRINGASASMACDGNISLPLLKAFDKLKAKLLQKNKS